jgi:hypothetical protein
MPAVWLSFAGLMGSPYMVHGTTLIRVGPFLDWLFPCVWQSTPFASLSLLSTLLAAGCGVPSSQMHVHSRFMLCGPVGCAVLLALCSQPESGCPVTKDALALLYVPSEPFIAASPAHGAWRVSLHCHQCCF